MIWGLISMSKLKKAMMIGGFLSVFVLITSLAKYVFYRKTEDEVEELFSRVANVGERVTEEDLVGLPKNVQAWLTYAGVIGKKKIVSAHLLQKAEMRLERDKPWMPVEAEQYFTIKPPGFIWSANIKVAPFFHISGRDKYEEGKGHMLIKPLSLFSIADSKGLEIDQGTLLRYLAETMWFPTAVLSDYLTWEEVDRNHAKVTMTYGEITASGLLTFNTKGELVKFEAERYGVFNGETRLETWSISVREYKEFEGLRIPTKGEVTWELETGDFNWFNFEVLDIEYNPIKQ